MKALRDRGDITLSISQDAIDAWTPPQTGKRGAQPVYSDTAIETALALRLLFRLPLRQTEDFLPFVNPKLEFFYLIMLISCPRYLRLES
jgi:hypothetical protein